MNGKQARRVRRYVRNQSEAMDLAWEQERKLYKIIKGIFMATPKTMRGGM